MAPRWPDFFIIGAPKAGTTALHAALHRHEQLFLSPVKEPKFFLCGEAPPPLWTGPGDAHSRREWVWRRADYLSLFDTAPAHALRGESTPLYLADPRAIEHLHAVAPAARLIVILRDPVDRAYSNWMHLWSDGLEPEADFLQAVAAEEQRREAGWAPFWRYRGQGLYGQQLQTLYRYFPREQVLLLRYRDLVDEPASTLGSVWRFLDVRDIGSPEIPRDNTKPYVPNTLRTRSLAKVIRAGATAGAWTSPTAWRRFEKPLVDVLHRGGTLRPRLPDADRAVLRAGFQDDLTLLQSESGWDVSDWRHGTGRGDFASRAANGPSYAA